MTSRDFEPGDILVVFGQQYIIARVNKTCVRVTNDRPGWVGSFTFSYLRKHMAV